MMSCTFLIGFQTASERFSSFAMVWPTGASTRLRTLVAAWDSRESVSASSSARRSSVSARSRTSTSSWVTSSSTMSLSPAARREARKDTPLRRARTCYGHLAGVAGVELFDTLVSLGWIEFDEQPVLTDLGRAELLSRGVPLETLRAPL